MRARAFLLLVAMAASLGMSNLAIAQEGKIVADNPVDAGPDFALQGEYSGLLNIGYRPRRLGWQVVALGDGKFNVVQFAGGLPGDGWDGVSRTEQEAVRTGRFIDLEGPEFLASIGHDKVYFRDRYNGRLIGYLTKAHRTSRTMGAAPPPGAVALFSGDGVEEFDNGRMQGDLLAIGAVTKRKVQDFRLHVEFRTPFMPASRGQGRGNSGVYIQTRYEVQILDSFGLPLAFNECASLYRQRPPTMNVSLPPLSWQTYDIDFRAARFDDQGNKTAPAVITVRHNGVVVHDQYELENKTGAGKPEGPEPLPILFQNHGDPVHFRNIWLLDTSKRSAS